MLLLTVSTFLRLTLIVVIVIDIYIEMQFFLEKVHILILSLSKKGLGSFPLRWLFLEWVLVVGWK